MADTSKKRKRKANGATTSSKKVAVHFDDGGAKPISVKYLQSEGLSPAIISSSVAVPSARFKAFAKPVSEKHAARAANPTTHSIILRSTDHARLDYTALPKPNPAQHYIAVFDPAANKLSIAPAYHAQLQAVPRVQPVPEETAKKTFGQQRVQLGQEFGTKKAKKAIASRTVNAITKSSDDRKASQVQEAILDAVAEQTGAEELDKDQELEQRLRAKPIPMPNLSATSVEEVYPLTELLPPQDLREISVKEWQEITKAGESVQLYHRYPAYRMHAATTTTKMKALFYMAMLLRFHDALRPAGKAGKKVPKKDILAERLNDYSENLIDSVRRRFSENNELNKWHLEKLHTTICALSLYVDDCSTDTSYLRDDLRLDTKAISQYFVELGCKVRAMNDKEREKRMLTKAEAALVKIAVLKLPLDFPKLRSGRRK